MSSITGMARPRKPPGEHYRTPMMALRVPAELQAEIRQVAAERGETATALVLRAIRAELRRLRRHRPS